MTKAERAAEICEHCKACVPLYFWQGLNTHRIYKKINDETTRFSHVTCAADKIWKSKDG